MTSRSQGHDVFMNSSIDQDGSLNRSILESSHGHSNEFALSNNNISDSNDFKAKEWIPAEYIRESDVLCGRDKVSHSHIGNKRFQCVIQMNREAYLQATTTEGKREVSNRVLNMVHSYGGRFLKRDKETLSSTGSTSLAGTRWKDVGDGYAREKVTHALRSAKDPNRPRTRKPRVAKAYEPTEQENLAYGNALDYQKRLFQWLLKEDEKGAITETEVENSNSFLQNFE